MTDRASPGPPADPAPAADPSIPPSILIVDAAPPAALFRAERARLGWGALDEADAARALAGGLFDVCATEGTEVVGFARVVGDGALYFMLQDVIVRPDRRGRGVGAAMVRRLMTRCRAVAVPGATLGLMAATGAEGFYDRLGFARRPSDTTGAGMWTILRDPGHDLQRDL